MKVRVLRNTQGAACWYEGRDGQVFDAFLHRGLTGWETGDYETVDPACGKRALIASEDAEVVDIIEAEIEYSSWLTPSVGEPEPK